MCGQKSSTHQSIKKFRSDSLDRYSQFFGLAEDPLRLLKSVPGCLIGRCLASGPCWAEVHPVNCPEPPGVRPNTRRRSQPQTHAIGHSPVQGWCPGFGFINQRNNKKISSIKKIKKKSKLVLPKQTIIY